MGRSKWKGPYINPEFLKNRSTEKEQQKTLVISRNSEIVPRFLGLTFNIHNGKNYVELVVTEDMITHKFGEFSFTRAKFAFKKKSKKK
jgi:small subunit ribosomal protein S19